MKPILLFSDRLPQLLSTVTAVNQRLPELEFDSCHDVDQVFKKLISTNQFFGLGGLPGGYGPRLYVIIKAFKD